MNSYAGDVFPRLFNLQIARGSPRRKPRQTRRAAPTAAPTQSGAIIETDIPARLDALPFGRFHLLVIVALGITWILDGLEVTLAGALPAELKEPAALGLSNAQVGLAGSCYLAGAVLGAFFFGWLTDRLGRKKLFTITLAVYLLATAATGSVLGCLELRSVPFSHRRRHRRRIHCHQFDNPGAYPGAVPRLDRPTHQRQFLGRRGARCGRFARFAQSRAHQSGDRLAARFPDRGYNRTRDSRDATLDSGKPALAGDARHAASGR